MASDPALTGMRAAMPWIAALLMLILALFHPAVLNDGDTFWHVATGNWILDHHAVPHADPFSYTRGGAAWVSHEWLSDLLMALAFRAGGWSGVVALVGAAAAGGVLLLARYLDRQVPPLAVLALSFAAIGLTAPSLLARPHILVLPALAGWVVGLLRARDRDRPPAWWLLPLMTLWANLHGSYVLGLALVTVFGAEAMISAAGRRRAVLIRWGLFLAAAVAAAFLTPHGLAGLLHPFELMGMRSIPFIGEWQATDFSRPQPLEIVMLTGLYVLLVRGIKVPAVRLLLLLAVLHMALHHARHQMLLGFVAIPGLAGVLAADPSPAPRNRRGWSILGMALVVALVCARLTVPIERTDSPVAPVSALRHLPAALADQRVFNDYAFGGFLVFSGVRPFIDGRTDMYGDAFIDGYQRAEGADRTVLMALLDRYGVCWTLLPPASPAIASLDMSPGWRRLYADRFAVMHVRTAPARCKTAGVLPGPS